MNRFSFILLSLILSYILTIAVANRPDRRLRQRDVPRMSGQVVDENGPVAGAVIRIQTTDISTTSNVDGRFVIEVPDQGPHRLTAWAYGYFCEGPLEAYADTQDLLFTLHPHTPSDHPDYDWISAYIANDVVIEESSNCQRCHAMAEGEDTAQASLPFDEWVLDAHSGSATNIRFITMYNGTDIFGNQSPPTHYTDSRDYGRVPLPPDNTQPYYGPGYKLDFADSAGNCAACHVPAAAVDNPYGIDPPLVDGISLEGVTCDFCHKIWDVVLDGDLLPYANRPGVMSYEFRRPPEGHQFFAGPYDDVAPGEDTFSALQNESQFCAPCHFGDFWETRIYNSYGEWLESPYSNPAGGRTCQDCHMPPLGNTQFAREAAGGLVRKAETIFSHRMPGALDKSLLQNTATLDVEAKQEGGMIVVTVKLTNSNAGHHIPTDSPLRQILLVVEATDASGNLLSLVEGPTLPLWAGDLADVPGVYYAKILEQLWTEVVPSAAYWTHTRIIEDTRLAALETDISTYTFLMPTDETVGITVRVVFRRAFYDLMQQKGWDVPDIEMEQAHLRLP